MDKIYVASYIVRDFQRAGYEPEYEGDFFEDATLLTYDLSLYDENKEEDDYSYMIVAKSDFSWHCPYDDTPTSSFFDENIDLYVNDDAWESIWGFHNTSAMKPIYDYVEAYKSLLNSGMKREDIHKEDVIAAYQKIVEEKVNKERTR